MLGTTAGMLITDVSAVLLADRMGNRVPLKAIRFITAVLFGTLGLWTLLSG